MTKATVKLSHLDGPAIAKPRKNVTSIVAMAKRGEQASAPRSHGRAEIAAALERVRTALTQRGLLLLQDAELPATTTLIVGEVVRGSWWGHPQNKLIYETLQQLEDEVLWVKLVRGKETLVARPLWPALLGTARSREAWQLQGLSAACQRLLELVDAAPAPVRLDQVKLPAERKHCASELPGPAEARATLEAAVQDWPKPRLPWQ